MTDKTSLPLRKGNLELRRWQILDREDGIDVVYLFESENKDKEKKRSCMSVAIIKWNENEGGCEIQPVADRILEDDIPFQDLKNILKLGCEILRFYNV